MSHHMSYGNLFRTWNLRVVIISFCLLMIGLSSCGHETVFPDRPETHRLISELQEWPDQYYWLVATGVSSRVMVIPSADALLSQVEEQWPSIKNLETTGTS